MDFFLLHLIYMFGWRELEYRLKLMPLTLFLIVNIVNVSVLSVLYLKYQEHLQYLHLSIHVLTWIFWNHCTLFLRFCDATKMYGSFYKFIYLERVSWIMSLSYWKTFYGIDIEYCIFLCLFIRVWLHEFKPMCDSVVFNYLIIWY